MQSGFELRNGERYIRFEVPQMNSVRCFLQRQHDARAEGTEGGLVAYDEVHELLCDAFDELEGSEDENLEDEGLGDGEDDDFDEDLGDLDSGDACGDMDGDGGGHDKGRFTGEATEGELEGTAGFSVEWCDDLQAELEAEFGDISALGIDGDGVWDERDIAEVSDAEAWFIAGLFGVGMYAPSWWLFDGPAHGPTCRCRPIGLLEVLQDHADVAERQGALDAHLGGLRGIWDHFWSGDALVNGSSELINGACSNCIAEGREHLGDVLDEARHLAEELGEALAAFHSRIDLGLDRYEP